MTQQQKNRRQMLEEFVAQHPGDAFARYGLALECTKGGDHDAAIQHFRLLLEAHPEYVPAYQHYGQLLARLERKEEARQILTAGIAVAQRVGNQHAGSEMEALLNDLS